MAVYKRGKIYYVDILLPDGKRHRRRAGPSKEVAENIQKDMEVQKAKGEFGFLPKDSELLPLFEQFIEKTRNNNSPHTVKRYKGIIENFKEFLAKRHPHITKHSHLKPSIFEEYKSYRISKEIKGKTLNTELQTLKSIMIMAIKWGYAKSNPAKEVETIKIKRSLEGGRWLNSEEVDKLLKLSNEWLYPIFYTFIYSGMRKSELENLTWDDIDFGRRIIKIRIKDDWTPKTDERDIPISDDLLKLLQKQKKKAICPLVFHDGEGKKIDENRLRRNLMSVTKLAGFPDVTKIHSLRHTYGSHLAQQGVPLPAIQKFMGHKNIQTTMVYAHLAPGYRPDVVKKLKF